METTQNEVKCIGRRRLLVEFVGGTVAIGIYLGDGRRRRYVATLPLHKTEANRLIHELTKALGNA